MSGNRRLLVIITGTSAGIGKSIKELLRKENIDIICLNRSLQDENSIYIDLSDVKTLLKKLNILREEIDNKYKEHTIVFINNAFMLGPVDKLGSFKSEEIIRLTNTNIASPIMMFNFLASLTNEWFVINMTSGAATSYNKYLGLYSASKLFIKKYLQFIILEEDNNCLGVLNFNPGIVKTQMHARLKENILFRNEKFNNTIPKRSEEVATEIVDFIKEKFKND